MKRRNFRAVVMRGDDIIGERDTFAWNSAIRASEAIVREYAREGAGVHHGARPVVLEPSANGDADGTGDRIYRRTWTSVTGAELRALVWEVV